MVSEEPSVESDVESEDGAQLRPITTVPSMVDELTAGADFMAQVTAKLAKEQAENDALAKEKLAKEQAEKEALAKEELAKATLAKESALVTEEVRIVMVRFKYFD